MNFDPFSPPGLNPGSRDDLFSRSRVKGVGRAKPAAPAAAEEEPLEPEQEPVQEEEEKAKATLRNPKWEAETVGFEEETDISVEADLPAELAKKTHVLFELFADAPEGPERITQGDGFIEDGKAVCRIPVFRPQFKEEDGSFPTKVTYRFTAKHASSDLLEDESAVKLVEETAGKLLEFHILGEVTFTTDKSFVRPEQAANAKEMCDRIGEWKEKHKEGKLAVFGHADAVGEEDHNKKLSERRAKSVHALLVKEPKTWEGLYQQEAWGLRSTQELLLHQGHDPGPLDGQDGPRTQAAVKEFQGANGLKQDGNAGPKTREALYKAFMDSCNALTLGPGDFEDIGGSAFMGCSEFNRMVDTKGPSEPNRRVAVLMFKSTKVFPINFPCQPGNLEPCRRQVAKKGARRNKGFDCAFYDQHVVESGIIPSSKSKANPLLLVEALPAAAAAPADTGAPAPAEAAAPAPASESGAGAPASGPAAPKAAAAGAGDATPDPVLGPGKLVALVTREGIGAKPMILQLKTDAPFDGTGLFTRSDANIDFFRKGSATPLKFDGKDNNFSGADLTKGLDLQASGVKASGKTDEITLTLALSGGTVKPGAPVSIKATSVEVTLDICEPRIDAATEPVKLPALAPGAPAPAKGAAATDKVFLGRPLPLQSAPKIEERATLIVQQVKPAGFAGTLVLKAENDKLALFADEESKSGEAPRALPEEIPIGGIPAAGQKFFVEGAKASAAARDTGIVVGLKGVADVADAVKITVCHAEICSNKKPADLTLVAQAPEKPERKSKSAFLPAPLLMGLKYDIEARPFIELAKPSAFKWTTASDKIKLKDDAKEVVGCHGEKLSAALDDATLELLLTTDLGKLKKRHKLTVVSAELNPVTTGTNILHTDDINKIENPSGCVILTGADAADAAKVPIYKMTKITPDPGWTDDDTRLAWWIIGGEAKADGKYDGKADFRNVDAAKYGKKIQVFGTQQGDVLIQPYSGGYGYGMFRANVTPIQTVKFRVNRILTTALAARAAIPALPALAAQPAFPGGGGVGPQPAVPALPAVAARPAVPARPARTPSASHAEAQLHMKIVNIYLRQGGIEMIPDDSAEAASPARAAVPALAAQPAVAAQTATPALPGPPVVPARPAVAVRPAVPAIPAVAASVGNPKIGKASLDALVEKVTLVGPGFFDVEVNTAGLTFGASSPQSINAIKINARNEVVCFAYIHSESSPGALATALLCPWNHAPLARANPPRQPYTVAGYTLKDKGTPSSSLIPKTGIPDDVPVGTVNMNVLSADMAWEGTSPATRKEELLWGVIVPTTTIDASVGGGATADAIRLAYGNTLAHELGHVFGLGHRGGGGVPDGLMIPANENLMHPTNPPPQAENLDIIQVKAMRFSEAFFRTP